MTVDKASLTILDLLGEGGFGKVYRARTTDSAETLAYKEFKKPTAEEIENLELLVAFRNDLVEVERRELDSFALWPRILVTSGGSVCGYLMELLPERFVEQAIVQTNGTGTTQRTLDWLANPAHARANGASLVVGADDIATRSTFAALIACTFAFLHRHGIVVGDVSMANILHADNPPEIRLIDLDSARLVGISPDLRQPHTVNLVPPECRAGQKYQTIETDLYKVAAMIYYVLASVVQMARDSGPLNGKVDDAGMTLFRRALNKDPEIRPSASEWYRHLYWRVAALAKAPDLKDFQASKLHGVQGDKITLTWKIEGHRSLALEMPSGERREIGVSASNSIEVHLRESGRYRLIADNDIGTVVAETAIVKMFVPPEVRFVNVPHFDSVERCWFGLSDDDISTLMSSGREGDLIDSVVASALPNASLPLDVVGDVLAPSFSRDTLDWSGLNDMVDEIFTGPVDRSEGLRSRLGRFRSRILG